MKQCVAVHVLLLLFLFVHKITLAAPIPDSSTQCAEVIGKLVSLQGKVEKKDAGAALWETTSENTVFCRGDSVRVLRNSRAAILLKRNILLRLDQNTTMSLGAEQDDKPLLLELLHGILYYFSINPRSLTLETPFVNGAVEGTEFLVSVTEKQSQITVFEGQVQAENDISSITIKSGQEAVAGRNQKLVSQLTVKSRKGVQWALHYPPVLDLQGYVREKRQTGDGENILAEAVNFYLKGDLFESLQLLEKSVTAVLDSGFYRVRISLYLTAGRVEEAQNDIDRLLRMSKDDSYGLSFKALIALIEGDVEVAEHLADKVLKKEPDNASALVVQSYIQQAQFRLEQAKQSIEKALKVSRHNGLLLARYAELLQSLDNNSHKAVAIGQKAVELTPYLAHPMTILGFAHLNRLEIDSAAEFFRMAIKLNQSDPLPRLGLGLVEIYNGNLERGRDVISIAAVLDPGNALIRSYLGKAYYEMKEYARAGKQLNIAREIDPHDPTSYYYSALLNVKENKPGAALLNLKKSMELNNNRAVFRSQLMLDKDLAARAAGTGRTFNQLGFEQLALNYGRKSLEVVPSDFSSHRLLADSYSSLPNHEIARVSELLQSQLLQPVNIGPVQPQLAESKMHVLDGTGPSTSSSHEFNQLFQRNTNSLLFNGIIGGNDTLGNDLVVSGVHDTVSYSLGQYYYTTDGFRENNDLEQKLYNGFLQWRLAPTTHLIGEIRSNKIDNGDLTVLFDPEQFMPGYREEEDVQTWRIGGRHAFRPYSEIIAAITAQQHDENINIDDEYGTISVTENTDSANAEIQHLYTGSYIKTIIGGVYYDGEVLESTEIDGFQFFSPETVKSDHSTVYGYGYIPLSSALTLSGAIDYDNFDNGRTETSNKFSPKVGLTWNPIQPTTLRLAWIKGVTRNMVSEQTVEPTQLSGFNQFYDDVPGTETELYGIGLDHEFSAALYGGLSYKRRDLEVPYADIFSTTGDIEYKETGWDEQEGKGYLYWLACESVSVALEYLYENFDNGNDFFGIENFKELTNHRGKLKVAWFHPSGARAKLSTTYVNQEGTFVDSFSLETEEDSDSFWIADASVGYLLPKGYGLINLGVKNLFNTDFHFQESDPTRPTLSHGQLILLRLTFNL